MAESIDDIVTEMRNRVVRAIEMIVEGRLDEALAYLREYDIDEESIMISDDTDGMQELLMICKYTNKYIRQIEEMLNIRQGIVRTSDEFIIDMKLGSLR